MYTSYEEQCQLDNLLDVCSALLFQEKRIMSIFYILHYVDIYSQDLMVPGI